MSVDTLVAPHPDAGYRVVDGRLVAIPAPAPNQRAMCALANDTGTLIWSLIESRSTVAEMLTRLAAWYPDLPPERLERETIAFVRQLAEAGLVMLTFPTPPA